MHAVLKITTDTAQKEYEMKVGEELIMGRRSDATLKIDDIKMSGIHVRFKLSNKFLVVTDLNSKNGTYLNGIQIEKSEMFMGDLVKVGSTLISISDEKTDRTSKEILTFPGPDKANLTSELNADFTGAREKNQDLQKQEAFSFQMPSQKVEVDLRQKLNGQIRLSKKSINQVNYGLSIIATAIDIVLLVLSLILPMLVVDFLTFGDLNEHERSMARVIFGLTACFLFLIWNFKILKFTFGEKIIGIEKKYQDQK